MSSVPRDRARARPAAPKRRELMAATRRRAESLRALGRIGEAWWVALAVLLFLAVTVWWLTQDNRVPDFDEGTHLLDAITVRNQILAGDLSGPFTIFNNYPPLVHIVGAIGMIISGGLHEAAAILADNFVFVPLLAGGSYVAGTVASNRRGGLLAALFALGAPMFVSEMREFYVDPGETAMVAASVGAILASRRFSRPWISALAGFLCSVGMLTKQTFPLFVVGLIVVAILRGGWRNWRGLIAFVLGGAALTLPWYVYHFDELHSLLLGATSAGVGAGNASGPGVAPPRYSLASVSWYAWDLVNHVLLTPLTLFFVAGTAAALWRFARHRDPDDLTPELCIGALVGYLGVTYISLKDPRYVMPALVYLAVLGSGWIATARPRWRRFGSIALGLVIAANFAMVSFGWGSTLSLSLPGAFNGTVDGARVLTFFSPNGYLRGAPEHDGNVLGLLQGLKRLHVRYVEFDGGSANVPDFDQNGLGVLADEAGLPEPAFGYDLPLLTNRDVFLLRHIPVAGDPPPCQRMLDGSGIYVEVGAPIKPFQEYEFVCPGRKPLYYHRTAPLPESITHIITGKPRQVLLGLFRALHRAHIVGVQFDASMTTSYMEPSGLSILATDAHLPSLPYAPATNGAHEGFLLDHVPAAGDPPPCVRLPDGSGIYVVLGNALIPFKDYRFYCPLPKPHTYGRSG